MKSKIEGILFVVGEEGITKKDLSKILEVSIKELDIELIDLMSTYDDNNRGIKIEIYGETVKLVTKKINEEVYRKLNIIEREKDLTITALEVLAIIAYNQPITRMQVDEVRGTMSAHHIRTLTAKELIEEAGFCETPGRPKLYKTTDKFLETIGISSLSELPEINEEEDSDAQLNLFDTKFKE